MGTVIGLLLGAGLWLVWTAVTSEPAERSARTAWASRLADVLAQAGAPGVHPGRVLALCAGVGASAGLAVLVLSGSPAIAACVGVLASWAPVAHLQARARRRRRALREVWPEVVDHLSSAVRAGLSLPEAVAQIGERGPDALRPAFRAFGEDYRASGRFEESLDALKARLADPVADRIVEALRLTREVGGTELGRLLRTLATFLREDLRTRGELEARQSWTVNAARLAAAAPWVVLLMLATRPEAARVYDTPVGVAVLVSGAVSTVIAYATMRRIARLPEDARVLR